MRLSNASRLRGGARRRAVKTSTVAVIAGLCASSLGLLAPSPAAAAAPDWDNDVAKDIDEIHGGRTSVIQFDDSAPGMNLDYCEIAGFRVWHQQAVIRLKDKDGHAYFMGSWSRPNGGSVFVGRVGDPVQSAENAHWIPEDPDGGAEGTVIWKENLTGAPTGYFNHPGDLDRLGDVVVVAGQNWNSTHDITACTRANTGTGRDGVLFYDTSNPATPVYQGQVTTCKDSAGVVHDINGTVPAVPRNVLGYYEPDLDSVKLWNAGGKYHLYMSGQRTALLGGRNSFTERWVYHCVADSPTWNANWTLLGNTEAGVEMSDAKLVAMRGGEEKFLTMRAPEGSGFDYFLGKEFDYQNPGILGLLSQARHTLPSGSSDGWTVRQQSTLVGWCGDGCVDSGAPTTPLSAYVSDAGHYSLIAGSAVQESPGLRQFYQHFEPPGVGRIDFYQDSRYKGTRSSSVFSTTSAGFGTFVPGVSSFDVVSDPDVFGRVQLSASCAIRAHSGSMMHTFPSCNDQTITTGSISRIVTNAATPVVTFYTGNDATQTAQTISPISGTWTPLQNPNAVSSFRCDNSNDAPSKIQKIVLRDTSSGKEFDLTCDDGTVFDAMNADSGGDPFNNRADEVMIVWNMAGGRPYTKSIAPTVNLDTNNVESTDGLAGTAYAYNIAPGATLTVDITVDLGQFRTIRQASLLNYQGTLARNWGPDSVQVSVGLVPILTLPFGSAVTRPNAQWFTVEPNGPMDGQYVKFTVTKTNNGVGTDKLYIDDLGVY